MTMVLGLPYWKQARKEAMPPVPPASRLQRPSGTAYLFSYRLFQIPLRSKHAGIRSFCEAEARHLLAGSFLQVSGSMGALASRLQAIAEAQQPVIILGELGTGKEQIAQALYLSSPRTNAPFVVADGALLAEKSWEFLLAQDASPLNALGCPLYFSHLEALPESHLAELLSAIGETNLAKRIRLLFSCDYTETQPFPDSAQRVISCLGCMTLYLPALRSRADEIPSLASLYLANLNMELGKQIIGFDPKATEFLQRYDWPNNYTQFQQVLSQLAAETNSSYIRGAAVEEILAQERAMRSPAASHRPSADSRTLARQVQDIVRQTLEECGGNQSAAAKRLGISRTTLWRHLNKEDAL